MWDKRHYISKMGYKICFKVALHVGMNNCAKMNAIWLLMSMLGVEPDYLL